MQRLVRIAFLVALILAPIAAFAQEKEKNIEEMSLEELLNLNIVSASNTSEKLADAPATVVVISREEIQQRGYTEMSQILDDLPGMQVTRPFGDTYFKNYWRGYRNTIGEPFLILLDGMVFNHLYYNTGDVLVAFPLSNADRIEVVYGPASSVYGANAFMGVINVITRKDREENGSHERGNLTAGSWGARIADINYFFKSDAMRFSITGRFDDGNVDPSSSERFEYTKNKYFGDRRLWGGFLDNPALGGKFDSPWHHRAIDARMFLEGFEAGVQYFQVNSGYGSEYSSDSGQNLAVWDRPDVAAYARATKKLNGKVTSTTLLRWRRSDLTNDSTFTESYDGTRADGSYARVADFSYWQSLNSSVSLFQDFDVKASPHLSYTAGIKYEQKSLQKAYDNPYGPTLPVDLIHASSYPYPVPPTQSEIQNNRIKTEDRGLYVQARYRLNDSNILNLGVRNDHNSEYGGATTVRGGYVKTLGKWGFKFLAGNAFQEPAPRLLYGGWTGSGSDPNLRPERSRTIEASGSYTVSNLSGLLSVWDVRNRDTIINTKAGAQNIGRRHVDGLDLHGQMLINVPSLASALRLWGYYSHIFKADEDKISKAGVKLGTGFIGDLAKDELWLGATADVTPKITTTLRSRYVSSRKTVDSNPIDSVPSYFTADFTGRIHDVLAPGLGLSLNVLNLFDKHYYQPGVRDANSGDTPGFFDAKGVWHGSGGFYNSLLPQPGRAVMVTLDFRY